MAYKRQLDTITKSAIEARPLKIIAFVGVLLLALNITMYLVPTLTTKTLFLFQKLESVLFNIPAWVKLPFVFLMLAATLGYLKKVFNLRKIVFSLLLIILFIVSILFELDLIKIFKLTAYQFTGVVILTSSMILFFSYRRHNKDNSV
jgi:hypothetical protein